MARTPASGSGGQSQRPHWPAIDAQLQAMQVIPGSAFEKLIRDNQNFDMLLPGEAQDGLPFPPWLRVWWRKKHPELRFEGPRVGYPLGLMEIFSWMRHHQDLPPGPNAGTLDTGAPGRP